LPWHIHYYICIYILIHHNYGSTKEKQIYSKWLKKHYTTNLTKKANVHKECAWLGAVALQKMLSLAENFISKVLAHLCNVSYILAQCFRVVYEEQNVEKICVYRADVEKIVKYFMQVYWRKTVFYWHNYHKSRVICHH